MKNIFLALLLILVFSFAAYGASSDDVYLRRDVFEAKMDALIAEIRLSNEQLRREMDRRFNQMQSEMDKRFNQMQSEMDKRFNQMQGEMDKRSNQMQGEIDKRFNQMQGEMDKRFNQVDGRFNSLEKQVAVIDERTESTRTTVYWGLAFFGIFIVLVSFAPGIASFLQTLRKPQLTIEDVEKIFDKKFDLLNAKLAVK